MENDLYNLNRSVLTHINNIRNRIDFEYTFECTIGFSDYFEQFDNLLETTLNSENEMDFEDVKVVLTNDEFNKISKEYKIDKSIHKDCTICMEVLCENESVNILPCGHYYHKECIKTWLCNENVKCPICRSDTRGIK